MVPGPAGPGTLWRAIRVKAGLKSSMSKRSASPIKSTAIRRRPRGPGLGTGQRWAMAGPLWPFTS